MKTLRARKFSIALLAVLLLLLGACKGESPTAPPTGGGNPPGGTIPPTNATLTLIASNTDPVVDSSVVLTATATLNGQPVPNGTAVEFRATDGVFDGGTEPTIVKTTTTGVATATLTSGDPGQIRISATVNNVTKVVDVTFRSGPIIVDPPDRTPTIASITPSVGRPAGGQSLRIAGANFRSPVKVLFDVGKALPVEAFVISSTETAIEVITPAVDLGAGQQLESDVIVIVEAGSSGEQRVESAAGFTFRNEQLTPRISTAMPNSGPVTGDTRVTIVGDGFQAPVQVLFGAAEARVLTVNFSEIVVMSPAGRDTSDTGSGAVLGPVTITVRNINSQTSTTLPAGFRYINAMQITAAGPTEGPFTGGTRVSIDGVGFVAPVAVSIGGVAATPISVSGTKVIAITSGVVIIDCEEPSGPITVTNIVNGDGAEGPTFVYRVPKPIIVGVTPSTTTEGGSIDIIVANAQAGVNRIKIGDRTVFPTAVTFSPDGTATFTVAAPTGIEFETGTCTVGGVQGERALPAVFDVTYENATTGCTDTADDALTINPPDTSCLVPGPPEVAVTAPATTACPGLTLAPIAVGSPRTGTITLNNVATSGSQSLSISSVISSDAQFAVTPSTADVAAGSAQSFTVTFTPTAVGPATSNITFSTNDPDEGSVVVCVTGSGI